MISHHIISYHIYSDLESVESKFIDIYIKIVSCAAGYTGITYHTGLSPSGPKGENILTHSEQ